MIVLSLRTFGNRGALQIGSAIHLQRVPDCILPTICSRRETNPLREDASGRLCVYPFPCEEVARRAEDLAGDLELARKRVVRNRKARPRTRKLKRVRGRALKPCSSTRTGGHGMDDHGRNFATLSISVE